MTCRTMVRGLVVLLCVCVAGDALAARRGVRVELGGAWGNDQTIGSADCPGSTAGSTLLERFGLVFSGRNDPAHLFQTYCQDSEPDLWDEDSLFGEEGLSALIGPNDDNAVSAIRYIYSDQDRNDSPTGFQWLFVDFPNGVTIVGLNGFVDTVLNNHSYIRAGHTVLWQGTDGFDGEYFCFVDGAYVGTWSGDLAEEGSACLAAFDRVFADGFE